jgi:hypothetical protein
MSAHITINASIVTWARRRVRRGLGQGAITMGTPKLAKTMEKMMSFAKVFYPPRGGATGAEPPHTPARMGNRNAMA